MKDELKVGSTIYRRNGEPVVITGETKISWIIGNQNWDQVKIKKSAMRKGNDGERWIQFFSNREDAMDCKFCMHNRYNIGSFIQAMEDGKILRQIAELIGYKEKE